MYYDYSNGLYYDPVRILDPDVERHLLVLSFDQLLVVFCHILLTNGE